MKYNAIYILIDRKQYFIRTYCCYITIKLFFYLEDGGISFFLITGVSLRHILLTAGTIHLTSLKVTYVLLKESFISVCLMRVVQICRNVKNTTKISGINPLKPELNPICYLLALLAHHFLHVSRIRVKLLTFRRLMSYIYIYIWSTHS